MTKFVFAGLSALSYLPGKISSHGCGSYPPARNWICSGRGAIPNLGIDWNGANGPNVCKQENHEESINTVMVDWSSIGIMEAKGWSDTAAYIEDPRKPHINIMKSGLDKFMATSDDGMDAKVCSGNMKRWHALDDTIFRRDQGGFDAVPDFEIREYPTKMPNGPTDFIYTCSAPHRTTGKGYVDHWITKDGVSLDKELTWADFEPATFCSYMPPSYPSPMQQTGQPSHWHHINSEKYECTIPEDKIGDHVILRIWQRDDTGEAFYDCADVILSPRDGSEVPTSATTPEEEPTEDESEPTDAGYGSESPTVEETETESTETESSDSCPESGSYDSYNSKMLFDEHGNIQTYDGNCITVENSVLKVVSCMAAQKWEKFGTSSIKQKENNLCWEVKDKKFKNLSHGMTTGKCKDKTNQAFGYDSSTGQVHVFLDDRYCVSISGDELVLEPCVGVSPADDKLRSCFGV